MKVPRNSNRSSAKDEPQGKTIVTQDTPLMNPQGGLRDDPADVGTGSDAGPHFASWGYAIYFLTRPMPAHRRGVMISGNSLPYSG